MPASKYWEIWDKTPFGANYDTGEYVKALYTTAAMQKRPSPDMLWRTSIRSHRLGDVEVGDGDLHTVLQPLDKLRFMPLGYASAEDDVPFSEGLGLGQHARLRASNGPVIHRDGFLYGFALFGRPQKSVFKPESVLIPPERPPICPDLPRKSHRSAAGATSAYFHAEIACWTWPARWWKPSTSWMKASRRCGNRSSGGR